MFDSEREELVKLLLDEKDQLLKRVESEEASDKLKQENKDLKATWYSIWFE